ncbi:Arabinose operon regulatory protein [Clostridiales bacterium CHKCI001]|nr:Arabinose operon regulatory protein [Clostridiales bacterium CHKCI001]
MYSSLNKDYMNLILTKYGFQQVSNSKDFNPLGTTWRLDHNIGKGYFWTYYHHSNLFSIKIHDFTLNNETIVESNMPKGLYIAYYSSISGEELNPYRRLNANCVRSHLNGYKSFKAIIHKNIPVHSIGIEITPSFYEDYLKKVYPSEYINPYNAFLEIDETTYFPEMVSLLKQIEDYKESGISGQLFFQAKILEAVALIFDRKRHKKQAKEQIISEIDMQHLSNVTSFINDHYAFDLKIDLLAKIACMGETKLKKLFKQLHKCTILEFIQNQRICQAEHLLSHTDYPIKQIATIVGYTHTGHFANLFQKATGLLPSEYRKVTQGK